MISITTARAKYSISSKPLSFLTTALRLKHAAKTLFFSLALLILFPASLRAQDDWVVLFTDNFENGTAENWRMDAPLMGNGWSVELDGGNYVLNGSGFTWAQLMNDIGADWTDYSFKARIKLLDGDIGLNYRLTVNGWYTVNLSSITLSFTKEQPLGVISSLTNISMTTSFGIWHNVEVIGVGGNIKVYIDDVLRLDYTDTNNLVSGGIGLFPSQTNSHVHIDDVRVVGKHPPSAPVGYTWGHPGGPIGGLGYDVRIHPADKNIMFVTDNPSGVNKSYDGGTTWVQRNSGITSRTGPSWNGIPIFSLTIDPRNPNIIWVGTQYVKAIYKSIDGGETWVKKDNGVVGGNEVSFRNFGINPYNSDIVFAGAEITTGVMGTLFDKAKGKIFKTEDGGNNWRCVWEGDNLVRFILFNPSNPQILYASTGIWDREAYNDEGVGVLKSTDGGETWVQINNGIPNSGGNRFVGFLEMHPQNPDILFAAAGNNAKGDGGIFRTTNGGESWTKVLSASNGASGSFTVVVISPSNPRIIYAATSFAFYRSDDGGDTWQMFLKTEEGYWGPPRVRPGCPISAVVDPDDPYTLFANNYVGGNFKSTDGAATWVDASKGYSGAHLHDITIAADNPDIVYTIGRSGPFKSYDGGQTWAGIALPPASSPEWYAIALNPENRQEVLMADEFRRMIFKSQDAGNTWREVFQHPLEDNPQERHGFKAIVYAPSNSRIVYAGMCKDRGTMAGSFPAKPSFGMYKSIDGGETWVEINNGLNTSLINIFCIAIHPGNPDVVYIGTWKDGVFKTTDGGQNWTAKNNGLTAGEVRSLAVDHQNPQIVYAGLSEAGGVFKSTDGGELWGEINQGLNLKCPSYLLPVGKTRQDVSLNDWPVRAVGGDYYSVPWSAVWGIAIDPRNSQVIYAADHYAGVYMSTNAGCNWIPLNDGLTMKAVTHLAISSDGGTLYAATEGGGVFRCPPSAGLDTPGNLTASKGTYSDKVVLAWSAVSGATSYEVWRYASNTSFSASKISSPDPTGTSYDDTNAAAGTTNYYWVKAVNAAGASAFSTSDSGWRASISPGVCADYDGDGLADPAIYDESTGTWRIKLSGSGYYLLVTAFNGLGGPGYASVSADYDGDRKADPAVYNEATGIWIILPSSLGYAVPIVLGQTLGGIGYSGMSADYDGDRLADPGVYQRTQGDWKILLSSASYYEIDKPGLLGGTVYRAVAADYDGDRLADPAIYGESNGYWIFKLSSIGYVEITLTQTLGGAGYIPVPADYDGDGLADPAVRSITSNEWIVMFSSGGYTPVPLIIPFE